MSIERKLKIIYKHGKTCAFCDKELFTKEMRQQVHDGLNKEYENQTLLDPYYKHTIEDKYCSFACAVSDHKEVKENECWELTRWQLSWRNKNYIKQTIRKHVYREEKGDVPEGNKFYKECSKGSTTCFNPDHVSHRSKEKAREEAKIRREEEYKRAVEQERREHAQSIYSCVHCGKKFKAKHFEGIRDNFCSLRCIVNVDSRTPWRSIECWGSRECKFGATQLPSLTCAGKRYNMHDAVCEYIKVPKEEWEDWGCKFMSRGEVPGYYTCHNIHHYKKKSEIIKYFESIDVDIERRNELIKASLPALRKKEIDKLAQRVANLEPPEDIVRELESIDNLMRVFKKENDE